MVTSILREDVLRLVREQAAQVVEVLPEAEYEDEHIAGAINIPLKKLNRDTVAVLDRSRPVIVYCHDALWDMSPRAAARLESVGFNAVYDYVPGKADWAAAGLPREGRLTQQPTADQAAVRDEVTCRLSDRVGEVAEKVRNADKSMAIVTTEEGVVLGRIRGNALQADPKLTAEEVMEPGPTTIRGNTALDDILQRLQARNVGSILVTTSDGKLVGTLYRVEAERHLAAYGEGGENCCCCKESS